MWKGYLSIVRSYNYKKHFYNACGEVFKTQRWPLYCNSEKVLYLLRCITCGDTPYVGKSKTKFYLQFNINKSKHQSFRKEKQNVPQKRFHSHYIQDFHRDIDDWKVNLFGKCQTHKQLKEKEMFWQHNVHLPHCVFIYLFILSLFITTKHKAPHFLFFV